MQSSAQNAQDMVSIMRDWNPDLPATAVRNMDRLMPKVDADAENFRALKAPPELNGYFDAMQTACQKSLDLHVQATHALRDAFALPSLAAASKPMSAVTPIQDAAYQAQLVWNDEIDKLKG